MCVYVCLIEWHYLHKVCWMGSQLLFGKWNQKVVLCWSVGCFFCIKRSLFLLRPSTVLWCLSVNRYYILETKNSDWAGSRMCGRRSFLAFCFLLFYAIWPCMLSVQCMIYQTRQQGYCRHWGTGPIELSSLGGLRLGHKDCHWPALISKAQ